MTAELTPEQIAAASRYLSETRDALLQSTAGLSADEWVMKPDPARWSIAQIVEHVAFVENRVHGIVGKLADAPEAAPPDQSSRDEFVMATVPDRTFKVEAPAAIHPSGSLNGEEGLEQFAQARQKTISLLSGPFLRGRVFPHPLFGPLDGYQWILAAAGHAARHSEQIREVRSQCAASA